MDMKKLTVLFFLLYGSFAFSQETYENKKLALINDVFYKSTRQNINSFMRDKGFEKGDVEEGEGDVKEILAFDSKFDMMEVSYAKNDKISTIVCIFSGAINVAFIDMELKKKGYTAKMVKQSIDGQPVNKNIWSKSGTKYNFVTYADEKEKIGVLGYGVY
ncbi:hypothetical protein QFZ20_004296 [Flavobacterium sp. W4I14]|nr:hypothetical protein [Flavobacterium sp. W4I14]